MLNPRLYMAHRVVKIVSPGFLNKSAKNYRHDLKIDWIYSGYTLRFSDGPYE
jgi:hypothetical protein